MQRLIEAAKAIIKKYENDNRDWSRLNKCFFPYDDIHDTKEIKSLREAIKDAEQESQND